MKETGGNYGLVSFSYGWSTTYTTWSIGVGPGASLPKVGTGAYIAGTTYLIGQPYYLNEGGNDPDDNRGTHVVH